MTRTFGRAAFVAALLASVSTGAMAQTVFDNSCTGSTTPTSVSCINGGGSTLALHVYGDNKSTVAPITPGGIFYQYTQTVGATLGYRYIGAGSGAGQTALLTDNPSVLSSSETGYHVELGASDAFVDSASVLYPYVGAGHPMTTGGQFIQFPTIATPITIPVKNPKTTFNGEAAFNDTDLCGIFSGLITNWKATSHGFNLTPGPITVYWRNDNGGSGTTYLLTQHLAKVCTTANTASTATFKGFSANTKFAKLFVGYTGPLTSSDTTTLWGIPTSSFANNKGAKGSGGVAAGVLNDTTSLSTGTVKGSAIGYLSPDYTAIATSTANPKLYVAALVNSTDGQLYTPTVANTSKAIQNIPGYAAPTTKAAAQIQTNWVPAIANPSAGYPVVGYTNVMLASCYKSAAVGGGLKTMLGQLLTGTYTTYVQNNGFVPALSNLTGLGAALKATFLTNSNGWNLDINNATTCKGVAARG